MNRIPTLLAATLLLTAPPVLAQSGSEVARVTVLPGYVTEGGTHMAALRVTLAPGWKTYWRSPGDAGIPPLISLSGGNVATAAFHWPTPDVFDQNGMRSIGYHDSLVLPVEVTALDGGTGPLRLTGTMDIGVCQDICIPAQLRFDGDLTPGPRDPAIIGALLDQPQVAGHATCRVTPQADGVRLDATLTLPPTGGAEALVIEAGDPQIWVSEPVIARQGGTLTATATMTRGSGQAIAFDRGAVRFTVLGQDRATEVRGCTAG
ncbi:Thiol-disulfide interchange protein, contains DsbC and DsbD domains [Loktanella fryxellensis]|uniref:Thiol-disulfide interchange protein, contains DsbC and DsbD domains n=1 Tax=Loktanella fryxellensis TaxID=245187 RepID=A0A1H8B051_9RHOB|nr:protein-disulfide reductase DsbD domain-containing protein [Loktanella fryxellensis]SEM76342.1 Thiol-disulfide interchange protein, contains DsbC and DsbD domains [Loktanella fryxellensis]